MYYVKFLIFLGLSSLSYFNVTAQNKQNNSSRIKEKFSHYQHHTMAQGLSNNSVNAIAQDHDGFLWFGTNEGLNRFDGENFKQFFHRPTDKLLPSDDITQLLILPNNELLVGTRKGLCLVNTRFLTFKPVPLPFRLEQKDMDLYIMSLLRTKKGEIWVGTASGVFVLDAQCRIIQSFQGWQHKETMSYLHFGRGFIELPNGMVALKVQSNSGKYSGWQVIDFQQQKLTPLAILLPYYSVLDTANLVKSVVLDASNNIWFTALHSFSKTTLFKLNGESYTTEFLLKTHTSNKSRMNVDVQYWYPTFMPDSLLLLQRYFGKPTVYNMRDGSLTDLDTWTTSYPDGKLIQTFVDRDDNLWLCPTNEGVYFLSLKNTPITVMTALNTTHKKIMKQSHVSQAWFSFMGIEQGEKWIIGASTGGLYSLDKKTLGVSGTVLSNIYRPASYIYDMAPDRGDTVWLIAFDNLYWYNTSNNTEGLLKKRFKGLDSLDRKFLHRDRYGLIWGRVANNGVCYFDTYTRQFKHFPSQGTNAVFPLPSASGITEDPVTHDMWFSYANEKKYLVKWTRQTGTFQKVEPLNQTGKTCTTAHWLKADAKGNIWIQNTEGVFVMNTQTLEVKTFGKNEGLNTHFPNGFCTDMVGNMWFATANGLFRYDQTHKKISTFYQADGLLSNYIFDVSLLDTTHNILLVSTDAGLCLFEPHKIKETTARTFITSLWASDSLYALPESNIWTLPYHKNDIRIAFSSINFINGQRHIYQYSLEPQGSPKNWKNVGTDNIVNFNSLATGKYTFRVRVVHNDDLFSHNEAILTLVIHPPWWKTTWFLIALSAVLLTLGWYSYRLYWRRRLHIVQLQLDKVVALNQERQRIAADMHDDIGSDLSALHLKAEMIRQKVKLGKQPMSDIDNLIDFTRDIAKKVREVIWTINARHDSLSSIIHYFDMYADDFFENSHIVVSTFLPPDIPQTDMSGEKRKILLMCFKETLHNAYKHAQASEVKINYSIENDALTITIQDNGVGFDRALLQKEQKIAMGYSICKNV